MFTVFNSTYTIYLCAADFTQKTLQLPLVLRQSALSKPPSVHILLAVINGAVNLATDASPLPASQGVTAIDRTKK